MLNRSGLINIILQTSELSITVTTQRGEEGPDSTYIYVCVCVCVCVCGNCESISIFTMAIHCKKVNEKSNKTSRNISR